MARRKKKAPLESGDESGDSGVTESQAEFPVTQEASTMTEKTTPDTVVIDYRGETGVDGEGRPVHHKSSPHVFMIRDASVTELYLQPGANLVDAEKWALYCKKEPGVKALVEAGRLTDLDGKLPEIEWQLRDLIDRTIARDALDWIVSEEKAGRNRERVIASVAAQAAKTTVCTWEPGSWVNAAPNMSAGMRA